MGARVCARMPGAARLEASAAPAPAVPAMNLRRDMRRVVVLRRLAGWRRVLCHHVNADALALAARGDEERGDGDQEEWMESDHRKRSVPIAE